MLNPDTGRKAQKARTRRDLLETTARLLQAGRTPTLEEAAEATGVSRRTAYRYFRSQEHLLADAALETLRPELARIVEGARTSDKAEERVAALAAALHWGNRAYETPQRAILAAAYAPGAADPATGAALRGHQRVEWVRQALEPLNGQLTPGAYERLVSALTVIVGYDAYGVLRDMRRLPHEDVEPVIQWMARSLIQAARQEG